MKENIDWKNERDSANQMGLVMNVYIDKSLTYVEKTNPFTAIVDKIPTEKKAGVEIDWSTVRTQVQSSINTWLETFDDILKAGKSLPVDLISKAAELSKKIKNEESHEEHRTSTA